LSISVARRKRTALYLSITGLMLVVAAISAISARDPDGVVMRTGMILVTVGASMWLPWQALIPATLAVWLGPNLGRNAVEGYELFGIEMMLELPSFLGLAGMSTIVRFALRDLEQENLLLGISRDGAGLDPATGVYEESQLHSALEMELSRARRFGRTFSLVLVGIDEMRQRFDYRDEEVWQASFAATAELLRGTRANVDRVYRYGPAGFALLLPESEPKDVNGLVRRLRRVARKAKPREGEPGGPLPAHYGATFFPTCATTVADLVRRAEIALRLADNNASRIQLDGAEAPEMPPAATLRQVAADDEAVEAAPEPESTPEPIALPTIRILEPPTLEPVAVTEEAAASSEAYAEEEREPEPVHLQAVEEPEVEAEPQVVAPTPLYAVETPGGEAAAAPEPESQPATTEAEAPQPAPVFAYRAPEPAVDVYNRNWQAEAPLSVIHRPQPEKTQVVAFNGATRAQVPVDQAINDALKQLDGTLELIRSLKRRSA
jgi:diguanylate cyclase (GGDEF)-like protein